MIRKFDRHGRVVEFETPRVSLPDGGPPVEIPILLDTPEQKYEGKWEPGINHPTMPAHKDGPLAGLVMYYPIPESQIQR